MSNLINDNPKERTYNELSIEFRQLYPTAFRALQLIPLMYNRLTLIDGLTHKIALKKMHNDHKDLPGFSRRNIYRALPQNNPTVPKRVVPKRHNPSETIRQDTNSSSCTVREKITKLKGSDEQTCPNCLILKRQKEELEQALQLNAGAVRAVDFRPRIQKFTILKERHTELVEGIKKSTESIYLEFDDNGKFLSVIPDSYYCDHCESDMN